MLSIATHIKMPKAIAISKVEGKPGKVYYPLDTIDLPDPKPKDNEVVVKITAAAQSRKAAAA